MSDKKTKYEDTFDFDICNSSSSTDCTGLIQTPPQTQDEWEAYNEVYKFQPTPVDKKTDESAK